MDAALFALLRDKFKSGKTEQAFELKDTQRLKKHLQQVRPSYARASNLSPFIVFVLCDVLKRGAFLQVFNELSATPSALQ